MTKIIQPHRPTLKLVADSCCCAYDSVHSTGLYQPSGQVQTVSVQQSWQHRANHSNDIGGFFGTEATAVPPAAFLTSLLAAFFWSCANIIVKRASDESARNGKPLNMMEMLVWSSIFVPLPMLCISLVGDGPDAILQPRLRCACAIFGI